MRYRFLFILFFFFANADSVAQDIPNGYQPVRFGIEQDILPYFLRGFILSGWAGMKHTRLRFAYAQANSPAFYLKKGIDYERTTATHLAAEFFFKEDFKGFWVGPSVGYWLTKIRNETLQERSFTSVVFSVGGGYNWYLYKGLYLSPWLAGHLRLTGIKDIELGTVTYKPSLLTPEVSIKIGWRF